MLEHERKTQLSLARDWQVEYDAALHFLEIYSPSMKAMYHIPISTVRPLLDAIRNRYPWVLEEPKSG